MGVFNGAQYLRDTIDSVLDQQGVDFEFIIVDDGSDDETEEILLDCGAKDPRIQVLKQRRLGLTRALISGCERACGEFIARQDNGDYSFPGRFKAQVQALAVDKRLAFVSCWSEFCGPENEFLYYSKGSGKAKAPLDILAEDAPNGIRDGPSCHPSVMIRRADYCRVGGYRQQFYFGQDWDLWFRLAEVGTFQMIERVLYRARVMPNSLSGRHKALQDRIGALSHQAMLCRRRGRPENELLEMALMVRPPDAVPASAQANARGLYFIGEQLRRNGDKRAERYFRQSVRAWPPFMKSWLRLGQLQLMRRR